MRVGPQSLQMSIKLDTSIGMSLSIIPPGCPSPTASQRVLKALKPHKISADRIAAHYGPRGLVTFYVFFLIELATRRIEIAGITPSPNEAWMMQIGRNLTDPTDGFLAEKELLILDRDSKYAAAFRNLLKDSGITVVRLPPRSPNLNAYA